LKLLAAHTRVLQQHSEQGTTPPQVSLKAMKKV